MEQEFDIAVIGAGPGGYVAALKAAQLGANVVVIEEGPLGGTCLNNGCIPSKALLASAQLLDAIHSADKLGINIEGRVSFDWKAIQQRKDKVLARLRSGIRSLFFSRQVKLVQGHARLASPSRLLVQKDSGQQDSFVAKRIIIACGSVPATIPGWPDDPHFICTSDQALHWKDLPACVLIVGGGVIGCEFACMLREFGVDVTIVEILDRLLPGMEPALGRTLNNIFTDRQIKVLTKTKVEYISISDHQVRARLSSGHQLDIDRILVATGRRANTSALGLENIPIHTEKGFIKVNARMQTSVSNIYCIGDANGICMLAHAASAQGICAVQDALGQGRDLSLPIPSAVYTFPEVCSVGLTTMQARQQGIPIRIGYFPIAHLGKAQASGCEQGFVLIITDRHNGTLLGMHMIGAHATEIVHIATAMLGQRASAEGLAEMVFAHPTISEAVKEAAEDSFRQAIHLPPRKVLQMAAQAGS